MIGMDENKDKVLVELLIESNSEVALTDTFDAKVMDGIMLYEARKSKRKSSVYFCISIVLGIALLFILPKQLTSFNHMLLFSYLVKFLAAFLALVLLFRLNYRLGESKVSPQLHK